MIITEYQNADDVVTLTQEEIAELDALTGRVIIPDEDCPEITPEKIGTRYKILTRKRKIAV